MDEEENEDKLKEKPLKELPGVKEINQIPPLEKMYAIPVGTCVSMKTDIGGGRIEEVEVCRIDKDTFNIDGPNIETKIAVHDAMKLEKPTEQSTDEDEEF